MLIQTESDLTNAFFNYNQIKSYAKTTPTPAAGAFMSCWAGAGNPGAGSLTIGNTTTGVIPTKATTGAIAYSNPSSGGLYVAQASLSCSIVGTVTLYDRLWHGGSYTSVAGAISANTTTAIDREVTGEGVELWAEIATVLSALATTITVTYVNQAGTGSRTATCILPASSIASRMYQFVLQAGDTGIRQITNISGSAAPTGNFNLILMKRLADIPVSLVNFSTSYNWLDLGAPKVSDNACLATLFYNQAGTGQGTFIGKFSLIG